MAKRITEILIDDLDGTEIAPGDGRTIRFSIESAVYEIDLTDAHAAQLRDALAPFIKVARKSGAPARSSSRTGSRPALDMKTVRTWLRAHGHQVSDHGRIPAPLLAEYSSAHD